MSEAVTAPTGLEPTAEGATTTIVTRIRDRARQRPNEIAMRYKDRGVWQGTSWSQYWERAQLVGHALLALGVRPGDRVAIHSENRPEWMLADVGTVAVRAITLGFFPTTPASEVQYLSTDSGAKVLIVEDQEQLDKVLALGDEVPEIQHIVYIEPRGIKTRYSDPRLLSWERLLSIGDEHRQANPGAVEDVMNMARMDDPMTIVYTSGTTGRPKGAVLTVANVEFAIQILILGGGFASPPLNPQDMTLAYIPMASAGERLFSTWPNAAAGVRVNFAESISTVQRDLREVQPTVMLAVPRILEKILADIAVKVDSASPLKRAVAKFWLNVANRIGDTLARTGGRHTVGTRALYGLGWLVVYRALRDRIGMRMVRYAWSAAAPIAPEVLKFFMGIGVPIHEAYGMSENLAIATANRPGRVKLGTVGEVQPGIDLRIDNRTGEILVRHPGVFDRYWNKPQATAETIDEDGWLHTGDVGEWVEGSYLRIVGRMQEIFTTASGDAVAPAEIENALKASPHIKEAVLIGSGRHYCTALIGIELDTVGDWAQQRRIPYTTYRDLSEKPQVVDLVGEVVDAVNGQFPAQSQIRDFRMLTKELDHEDGELTATQKVKREAVEEAFAELIASMYTENTDD